MSDKSRFRSGGVQDDIDALSAEISKVKSYYVRQYWEANNNGIWIFRLGWIRVIRFWNAPSNVISQIRLDPADCPLFVRQDQYVVDRGTDHQTKVVIEEVGTISTTNQTNNLHGVMWYMAKEYKTGA